MNQLARDFETYAAERGSDLDAERQAAHNEAERRAAIAAEGADALAEMFADLPQPDVIVDEDEQNMSPEDIHEAIRKDTQR